MKRKTLLLASFFGILLSAEAQQISLYSQYVYNRFVLNPAAAGANANVVPVLFTFRKQWDGLSGGPATQTLSANAFIGKGIGIGGYIFNDISGPTRRTGANLSLAYQLKISESMKLGFGVAGMLSQYSVALNELTTSEPDDNAINGGASNALIPDFNFGLYFHGTKFYVGASAFNLIQTEFNFLNSNQILSNSLQRTYYLLGGYKFDAGKSITIEPSALFQIMEAAPFQFDINLMGWWRELLGIGLSYRNDDAIVIMAGFKKGIFQIGYSYDIGISELANFNHGSHEILLGLNFNRGEKQKKSPWFNRNRIYTPQME